jgi:hypothetical protein
MVSVMVVFPDAATAVTREHDVLPGAKLAKTVNSIRLLLIMQPLTTKAS